jgi:hypothetical protein
VWYRSKGEGGDIHESIPFSVRRKFAKLSIGKDVGEVHKPTNISGRGSASRFDRERRGRERDKVLGRERASGREIVKPRKLSLASSFSLLLLSPSKAIATIVPTRFRIIQPHLQIPLPISASATIVVYFTINSERAYFKAFSPDSSYC